MGLPRGDSPAFAGDAPATQGLGWRRGRLREWVLAASDEDLELILKALAVQVKASQQRIDIEGAVPVLQEDQDLVTIARTSGSLVHK